jgi:transposase
MVEGGMTQSQVAADLGLRANMLSRWVREYRERGGESGLSPSEREELKALRSEVRELRMQRDILKKATAFFARESK